MISVTDRRPALPWKIVLSDHVLVIHTSPSVPVPRMGTSYSSDHAFIAYQYSGPVWWPDAHLSTNNQITDHGGAFYYVEWSDCEMEAVKVNLTSL